LNASAVEAFGGDEVAALEHFRVPQHYRPARLGVGRLGAVGQLAAELRHPDALRDHVTLLAQRRERLLGLVDIEPKVLLNHPADVLDVLMGVGLRDLSLLLQVGPLERPDALNDRLVNPAEEIDRFRDHYLESGGGSNDKVAHRVLPASRFRDRRDGGAPWGPAAWRYDQARSIEQLRRHVDELLDVERDLQAAIPPPASAQASGALAMPGVSLRRG